MCSKWTKQHLITIWPLMTYGFKQPNISNFRVFNAMRKYKFALYSGRHNSVVGSVFTFFFVAPTIILRRLPQPHCCGHYLLVELTKSKAHTHTGFWGYIPVGMWIDQFTLGKQLPTVMCVCEPGDFCASQLLAGL